MLINWFKIWFVSGCLIKSKATWMMAWHRLGDKPSSKPVLTWIADSYVHHLAPASYKTNDQNLKKKKVSIMVPWLQSDMLYIMWFSIEKICLGRKQYSMAAIRYQISMPVSWHNLYLPYFTKLKCCSSNLSIMSIEYIIQKLYVSQST